MYRLFVTRLDSRLRKLTPFLLFVVLAFVSSALPSHSADRNPSVGSKLISSAPHTVEIDGLTVSRLTTSDTLFHLMLTEPKHTVIATYDLNGNRLESSRFSVDDGFKLTGSRFSQDGSTMAIYNAGTEKSEGYGEWWTTSMYTKDGSLLFERGSTTGYDLSPSGKYFANSSGELSDDPFVLLDRKGNELLRIDRFMDWTSEFMGDDTLLVIADDSLYFFSTSSASILSVQYLGQGISSGEYRVTISRPFLAIYDWNTLRLFSISGDLIWQKHFSDQLQDIAIDTDSEQILLCIKQASSRSAYLLIFQIQDPEHPTLTFSHEALATITPSNSGPVYFQDGLIVMWSPRWVNSLSDLRRLFDPKTFILDISTFAGETVEAEVIDGLYLPIRTTSVTCQFINLSDEHHLTIHQVARRTSQ